MTVADSAATDDFRVRLLLFVAATSCDMRYFTDQEIVGLKEYQYRGIDRSLLSKHILQPYWTWLVEFVPLWVACVLILL